MEKKNEKLLLMGKDWLMKKISVEKGLLSAGLPDIMGSQGFKRLVPGVVEKRLLDYRNNRDYS